jgi:hypothetical protein
MNQLAAHTERLPMDSVGMSIGSTGSTIAPQNLAEVVKFAEVMCRADIALPKHLRGNAGACMAVALQALDWQMNPFAVASKSYQVNGAIAYEAQLIAAVVNTRSGIKGRLKYRYDGTGNDMTCTVTGTINGDELEYTTPTIGSITTKNSPLWKSDPQQQLGYFAARSWARRHTPEVILGVYDREEAEQFHGPDNARDVTPAQPSVMERLKAAHSAPQQNEDEREGFSRSFVHSETAGALTGEIMFADPDDAMTSGASDAGDDAPAPSPDADDEAAPPSTASSAATLFDGDEPKPIPADELPKLRAYAKDVLVRAADESTSADAMKKIEGRWAEDIRKLSPEGRRAAGSIAMSVRAVMRNDTSLESALEFHAEGLLCDPADIGGKANG